MKIVRYPRILALETMEDVKYEKGEIYDGKLKFLWKCCFGLSGLKFGFGDEKENAKPSLITILIAVTRFVITCHFFSCFVFNAINSCQIYVVANFLSATNNGILSTCCFFTLFVRKRNFAVLTEKITAPLIRVDGIVEKVWKKSVITLIWLLGLVVTANLSGCINVYASDRENAEKYLKIHYFNATMNDDNFVQIRTLFHVEIILLSSFILTLIDSTVVYFNYICQCLALNFKLLNDELALALTGDVASLATFDVVYFRRKHQRVARWVNETSALFSPLLFLCLLANLANFCFDLRVLKETESALHFVCFGTIAVRHLSILSSIAYNTTTIHSEANRSAEAITTATITHSSTKPSEINEYSANFILFGQRLSQSAVGINLFNFSVLSASSYISMFGTMLTYIIVLYQT